MHVNHIMNCMHCWMPPRWDAHNRLWNFKIAITIYLSLSLSLYHHHSGSIVTSRLDTNHTTINTITINCFSLIYTHTHTLWCIKRKFMQQKILTGPALKYICLLVQVYMCLHWWIFVIAHKWHVMVVCMTNNSVIKITPHIPFMI